MSALRFATPDGVRLVDLGPAAPAPLRGYSHRSVPGGSFARPLPAITPKLRAKWAADKQRARKAGAE